MPGLMDKLKGAASAAKVKVDVVVDKAGDKMPPKVKQTYEKMSDKVEKVIPSKKDGDIDEQSAGATVAAEAGATDLTGEARAAEEAEVHAAAQAEEAAAVAAEKAEGEADI
ncbi:MAG TPA: hypothetical protein VE487_20140 [Ilumatobacter sp.]|nr:hypothetical protein [Ilumatobacter sp.]